MNIWIDVAHIPQLNYYKKFIILLSENGNNVFVTVLDRGKLAKIAKNDLKQIKNVKVVVIGKHSLTKWSAIIDANVIRLFSLFFWAKKHCIDIAFSNHHQTSIIAKLLRIPRYAFGDDPQSKIYPMFVKYSREYKEKYKDEIISLSEELLNSSEEE